VWLYGQNHYLSTLEFREKKEFLYGIRGKKTAEISTDPCSRKERSGMQGCSEGTAGPFFPSSLS
jgi:hypothetical protein